MLLYFSLLRKREGFGGEGKGTAPGWFHLADPQALVACACPCPVPRPGPSPPPTVTCLNSNFWGLAHGLPQVWEGWVCLSWAARALPTPGRLPNENGSSND